MSILKFFFGLGKFIFSIKKIEMIKTKIEVIEKSLKLHESREPMKILQCFGGREFAAIFGAILAARFERVPVILDGFPVCAAIQFF